MKMSRASKSYGTHGTCGTYTWVFSQPGDEHDEKPYLSGECIHSTDSLVGRLAPISGPGRREAAERRSGLRGRSRLWRPRLLRQPADSHAESRPAGSRGRAFHELLCR